MQVTVHDSLPVEQRSGFYMELTLRKIFFFFLEIYCFVKYIFLSFSFFHYVLNCFKLSKLKKKAINQKQDKNVIDLEKLRETT